jgi:GT2 family glycosyltransferase
MVALGMSDVEVIIPHYSRWDLLERLLNSLDSQTMRPGICVVDNASTDDSIAQLERRGGVRICKQATNIGFGRAINRGVDGSRAKFVIFLNNDMVATPDFVAAMMDTLRAEKCVAAAVQLKPDGSVDTLGVAVDMALNAYDVGHGLKLPELERETLKAIGPSGGAAGFPRNLFLGIGGYDEAIFAYLEDVDLALRLAIAHIPTRVSENAIVYHHHSATLGSGSEAKNKLMGWARGYLLWKYRKSLSRTGYIRGLLVDSIVYLGQIVVDRNAGSLRGRLLFMFERPKTGGMPASQLPVSNMSVPQALTRRLGRR